MSKVALNRAAKTEAIYDVAAALFAEHGFSDTRMKDIAAGVGMSKPTLYHYFDSKELLLTSLVKSRVGVALEELGVIAKGPGTATERLQSAIRSHLNVFQTHSDVYTIYNTERFRSIDAAIADEVDRLGREYERLWGALLSEGVESGEFRDDIDVDLTVKAMLGSCNATLAWYRPQGRLTIDAVADSFATIFLRGLVP